MKVSFSPFSVLINSKEDAWLFFSNFQFAKFDEFEIVFGFIQKCF